MKPQVAWWSAVAASSLILFVATLNQDPNLLQFPWMLWVVRGGFLLSALSSLVMVYAWTHKPATERIAGLCVAWMALISLFVALIVWIVTFLPSMIGETK